MIAICPIAESQTSASAVRTGSLRRIDDILAELLAGYAAVGAAAGATADDPCPAAAIVGAELLVGGLVALPNEASACCTPAAEAV